MDTAHFWWQPISEKLSRFSSIEKQQIEEEKKKREKSFQANAKPSAVLMEGQRRRR